MPFPFNLLILQFLRGDSWFPNARHTYWLRLQNLNFSPRFFTFSQRPAAYRCASRAPAGTQPARVEAAWQREPLGLGALLGALILYQYKYKLYRISCQGEFSLCFQGPAVKAGRLRISFPTPRSTRRGCSFAPPLAGPAAHTRRAARRSESARSPASGRQRTPARRPHTAPLPGLRRPLP